MNDNTEKLIYYKKILIFGVEGSGKTTLTKRLKTDTFFFWKAYIKYNILHFKYIAFITSKIKINSEEDKIINLNVNEIRIDINFLKNNELINNFLFECQCALFLIDITNPDSFALVKELIKIINIDKYPYLNEILVINKIDLESERIVSNFEIKKYLEKNKMLDSIEISIKEEINIKELCEKMNKVLNQSGDLIPLNKVLEVNRKNIKFFKKQNEINLVLIGNSTVGKSAFLYQYSKNQFMENLGGSPGLNKEMIPIKIDNINYNLIIWDESGAKRFRSRPKKYYQKANGFLLLFDVTYKESFDEIGSWISIVKDYVDNLSNISIYLLGNRIGEDSRVITKEKAEEMAKSLGIKYFEINVKLNLNIREVMARIIMECHMRAQNYSKSAKQKLFKYLDY